MYIINAFWSVANPANEQAAKTALTALAAQMHDSEPDTWFCLMHTPNLDPGINIFPPPSPLQIAFVEGYKDQAAFLKHLHGPIMQAFVQEHGSLFQILYPPAPFGILHTLNFQDGFIRPEEVDPNVFQVEARWVLKPGTREQFNAALGPYIVALKAAEPEAYMYTVSYSDVSPSSPALPPMQIDTVTYNSAWKDHAAFVKHTTEPVYQKFLADTGPLWVLGAPGTNPYQPYFTTSVLKRFAGFLRPEAFAAGGNR